MGGVITLNALPGALGLLFAIGTAGVFLRRNVITILLSIEIMLNAVNLTFVAAGRQFASVDGQVIVFFVMTVAAAEAAVGLASSSRSSATGNRSTPRRSPASSGEAGRLAVAVLALIPLLPFAGFLVNAFLGKRLPKSISGGVACLAMLAAFGVSLSSVFTMLATPDRRDRADRLHVDHVGRPEHRRVVPRGSADRP